MTDQIKSLRLAIEALKRERRARYAAGNYAWRQGIREIEINGKRVKGTAGGFAEDGKKGYDEYTKAIRDLEDLIEILEDSGVVKDQPELF